MPLRKIKKITHIVLGYGKTLTFLLIFSYCITQPELFAIEKSRINTEIVKASYEEFLTQHRSQNDGSIQFESLIVGENGEPTISYRVSAGDTLGSIAKNFGTTTEAIIQANSINNPDSLNPGQKLTIAFDDGVIVNVKENSDIETFTKKYDLDYEEFMSMNYFEDDGSLILEQGRQVFVPLNQVEAQKKGLIDKEEFVMLKLPEEEDLYEELITVTQKHINTQEEGGTENDYKELQQEETQQQQNSSQNPTYEQTVISAQQTKEHLQNLKKQQEELERKAQEAKKAAEEEAKRAEEARKKAEIERTQEAQRKAEEARKAAEEAKRRATEEAKKAQEAKQRALEERKSQDIQCGQNQCAHKGKCRTKPSHSVCSPEDTKNARVCTEGYKELSGQCVDQKSLDAAQERTIPAPTKGTSTLSQRYANPHKIDKNVYGRGPGHCTAWAGYMRSQNHGIRIRDHRTGNAKNWIRGAKNAGFTVSKTPIPGSIMVTDYGYGGYGAYGHAAYVESVDLANGLVTITDMNYKGRYIVTRRTEAINKATGFIYPQ